MQEFVENVLLMLSSRKNYGNSISKFISQLTYFRCLLWCVSCLRFWILLLTEVNFLITTFLLNSSFTALVHFVFVSFTTAEFHEIASRVWRKGKEWGGSRVGKRQLLIMTSRRRRRRGQSCGRRLCRRKCVVSGITYYQLGKMLPRHCCWTVLTAVGQGGKGSEVLELVQTRPSAINTI